MARLRQSGEGMAGCLFWVAVLAAFIFIGYQAVPVKVKNADLEEFLLRQAESAGRASPEQIKERILNRAKELGLPVQAQNVQVTKGNNRIIIDCRYTVPISLLVYTYEWNFEHHVDRPYFLM